MDILQPLIRYLFYPLWMIYDGSWKGIPYLNHFNYIDTLSRDELQKIQNIKLRKLFIHAYTNTAYYKNVFDQAGLSPYEMDIPGDIKKLPYLTKKIINKHFSDLKAINIPTNLLTEAKTGGSTGTPLLFLRDRQCQYLRRGQELYFDRWMGYKIGEKVGYFVAGSHYDGRIASVKASIKNATGERALHFNPDCITDEYMAIFAKKLQAFKPTIIKSFPNTFGPFVHFVNHHGLTMPKVRAISCTGENLLDQQRSLFERTFASRVFQKVGTRESGVIACECDRHKGLHVFTEGVYLEIITAKGHPAQAGELGRVFITDLFNKAMPLIRYEIGDMAVAAGDELCSCGSPLPLIEKYLGRDRDVIIDSHGNPKPGYLFTQVIKNLNFNAQIQIVQPNKDMLLVRVVKGTENEVDLHLLESQYQELVGPNITIQFEFPDKIERDPSGKFSYVKSMVSPSD